VPSADQRSAGTAPLAAQVTAGAVAVLTSENPDAPRPPAGARLPAPPARLVGVQGAPALRPTTVALGKDAYAAISRLADGARITIEADVKAGSKTQTWNAVGRLTGSDPVAAREVILLSAHLDHLGTRPPREGPAGDSIFNGADDDASGVVAALELARAIAAGPRPNRTIVVALFGSEEQGGYGSRYFADRPVVPLTDIVANLQFEMIGRPDPKVPPHTLWLTGYERSTLGPALSKQGARLVADPHPEQNFFMRSDNIQFARRGVVAHTVSSYGLHKEYHQPSDEIGTIDFAHMTDAIRSMLAPTLWLANSGFKPEWLPGKSPAITQ
jgi:Zn-dependent M28 family amino/carboxypeptidase